MTVLAGSAELLAGVSLTANAGDLICLVGPNGIGKSTLFDYLAGVIPISRGTIQLKGLSTKKLDPSRLAHLGVVRSQQLPRVIPDLDVLGNILLGNLCGWHGLLRNTVAPWAKSPSRDRAIELAKALQIPPTGQIKGLSAAERRSLELCRCFLRPDAVLYLLDEPFANLDQSRCKTLESWIVKRAHGEDPLDDQLVQPPATILCIEHLDRSSVEYSLSLDLRTFSPLHERSCT